jgi:hypothetical protein
VTPDAKASRSGSFTGATACGVAARVNAATGSLSVLASRFATGSCTTGDAGSGGGAYTSTRPRMLATAAPNTRKHTKATIVMARVKPFSVPIDERG